MAKRIFTNIDDLTEVLDELITADDWRGIVNLVNFENVILAETDGGGTPSPTATELNTLQYCWENYIPARETLKDNLILDSETASNLLTNVFVFDNILPFSRAEELESEIDTTGDILVALGETYESERLKRDAAEVEVLAKYNVTIL